VRPSTQFERLDEWIREGRGAGKIGKRPADQAAEYQQHHERDQEDLARLGDEGQDRVVAQVVVDAGQRSPDREPAQLESAARVLGRRQNGNDANDRALRGVTRLRHGLSARIDEGRRGHVGKRDDVRKLRLQLCLVEVPYGGRQGRHRRPFDHDETLLDLGDVAPIVHVQLARGRHEGQSEAAEQHPGDDAAAERVLDGEAHGPDGRGQPRWALARKSQRQRNHGHLGLAWPRQ
jgi:hypothetical protein